MRRNLLSPIPAGVNAGRLIADLGAWGLLGSVILAETATGTHGAGALQNDGLNPALRYVPVLLSRSSPAFTLYPNGSYEGPVPSSGTYNLYESGTGLVAGSPGSITINTSAPPPEGLSALPQYTLGAPQDQILIVGGTASLAPGQRGLIAFDFRRYTSAPVNPVVTVLHESGPVDADPGAVRRGAPVVQGTKVFQYVESDIAEANYTLICQAENALGQEFLIAGRLPIRRLP